MNLDLANVKSRDLVAELVLRGWKAEVRSRRGRPAKLTLTNPPGYNSNAERGFRKQENP